MKTLLLQSDNPLDFRLILDLAKRLGMHYTEIDQDLSLEKFTPTQISTEDKQSLDALEEDIDTRALYEGLNLNDNPTQINYASLKEKPDSNIFESYTPTSLFDALNEVGGAWEDDQSETLEELLNMLTR